MRLTTRTQRTTATAVKLPRLRRRQQLLADYLSLMKPRIVALLLIVTFSTMLVAAGGWPGVSVVAFTLLGTALSAGGANAINCYFDADIDAIMVRTRSRPIPARRVSPKGALAFGAALGIVAFALLVALVNPLTGFIALGALAFYVLVYTVWLKRLTPQNIVIGGAAGAAPALVGWAAATGHLAPAALGLFAIIFYWTPPHFWALALLISDDYQRAGVPMLPVVRGHAQTRRQILLYSILLAAVTLLLVPVGDMGLFYLGSALALDGLFVGLAARLWRRPSPAATWHLWRYSVFYLALLFAAMVVDKLAA